MTNDQLDEYADFLLNYLNGTYEEYIIFEHLRDSTEIDWYKSDKLLLMYNIVQDCNSFFIEKIKNPDDIKLYIEYVNNMYNMFNEQSEVKDLLTPQLFVLGTILSPLLILG